MEYADGASGASPSEGIELYVMKVLITDIRKRLGIKQGELAKRAKMSQGFLSQIERGERSMTLKRQRDIAEALGVKPHELVDFTEERQSDYEILQAGFSAGNESQKRMLVQLARSILDEAE